MSEIKRKKGESFEGFMRRVKDQWKRSGKLLQARKIQFFQSQPSRNMRRGQAIAKSKKLSKITYLKKIGKLPQKEDPYARK